MSVFSILTCDYRSIWLEAVSCFHRAWLYSFLRRIYSRVLEYCALSYFIYSEKSFDTNYLYINFSWDPTPCFCSRVKHSSLASKTTNSIDNLNIHNILIVLASKKDFPASYDNQSKANIDVTFWLLI